MLILFESQIWSGHNKKLTKTTNFADCYKVFKSVDMYTILAEIKSLQLFQDVFC